MLPGFEKEFYRSCFCRLLVNCISGTTGTNAKWRAGIVLMTMSMVPLGGGYRALLYCSYVLPVSAGKA